MSGLTFREQAAIAILAGCDGKLEPGVAVFAIDAADTLARLCCATWGHAWRTSTTTPVYETRCARCGAQRSPNAERYE